MKIFKCLTVIFIFLTSLQGFADGVPLDPTGSAHEAGHAGVEGGSHGASGEGAQMFATCHEARAGIMQLCTMNPRLLQMQASTGMSALSGEGASGHSVGETNQNIVSVGGLHLSGYRAILSDCSQGSSSCQQICDQEFMAASAIQPRTPEVTTQMQTAQQYTAFCKAQFGTVQAQSQANMANIGSMISTALQVLKQLGLGGGDGSDDFSTAETDDECEKYNGAGILVGKCGNGDGEIPTSRTNGGLTGLGTPTGGTTGTGLQASSQDDPGGSSKAAANNGSGAFSPGGSAGMGAFGTASNGLGGTSGGAADGSSLDTDIHKGFMSADGAGGGDGYSAGGSTPARAGAFGKSGIGTGGAMTAQKAALQRRLSQVANNEKRGLASSGDRNGPFQDNWSVINKAYKKNSNTMFHQK